MLTNAIRKCLAIYPLISTLLALGFTYVFDLYVSGTDNVTIIIPGFVLIILLIILLDCCNRIADSIALIVLL